VILKKKPFMFLKKNFKNWLDEVCIAIGLKQGAESSITEMLASPDIYDSLQFEYKNGLTPGEAYLKVIAEKEGSSERTSTHMVNLNYVNPAKDFQFHLHNSDTVMLALKSHIEMLRRDAGILEKLANIVEGLPDAERKKIRIHYHKNDMLITAPISSIKLIEKLGLIINKTI
jgi:hypothetical protein